MIAPSIADARVVLSTLAHELIHVWQDASGIEEPSHKGHFPNAMGALGLDGKPTATIPGDAWADTWGAAETKLADYPHDILLPGEATKKQTTRMIKCTCPDCGYSLRTTQKWIDEPGPPLCPCNQQPMDVDGQEKEGIEE
jgi:hypothetical protein